MARNRTEMSGAPFGSTVMCGALILPILFTVYIFLALRSYGAESKVHLVPPTVLIVISAMVYYLTSLTAIGIAAGVAVLVFLCLHFYFLLKYLNGKEKEDLVKSIVMGCVVLILIVATSIANFLYYR